MIESKDEKKKIQPEQESICVNMNTVVAVCVCVLCVHMTDGDRRGEREWENWKYVFVSFIICLPILL